MAISAATTYVIERAAPPDLRLFHSHFPRSRLMLGERLAGWLVELGDRFRGSIEFVRALSLFAQESTTMRFASDHVDVQWYPPAAAIVEQGEASNGLFLILSGDVEVEQEDSDGSRRSLACLGAGEFFGEMGVAARKHRAAHVIAAGMLADMFGHEYFLRIRPPGGPSRNFSADRIARGACPGASLVHMANYRVVVS